MAVPTEGLSEHIEPILFTFGFIITGLVAIVGWFSKRTVGKIEGNVEDLWELVRKVEMDFAKLKAEHRVRHNLKEDD